MELLDLLRADWDALPERARLVAAGLAAAVLALLALWALAVSRRRETLGDLTALRAEAETLRLDRDRFAERIVARDERIALLVAEVAADRAQLADAHSALREALTDGARKAEAQARLETAVRDVTAEREELKAQHASLQASYAALSRQHAALEADSEGRLASARREIAALGELREEMSRRFEELATATLRQTGLEFTQAHTSKLTELLTPFREHVGRFETELRQVHKSADEERTRLSEQIRALTTQSERIRSEAANLTRALKGEKQKQGAWGEVILERLLEDSGLIRDTHYEVQVSRRDDEGAVFRPDVVVRMPRGKTLVIDSKVSLVDYEAAVSAETEEERKAALGRHVAALRRHIDTLADKDYARLEDGSVDYVLMFLPIEGALAAALGEQGDLTSYAVSRGVGVMTPTTLMVTLRTVEHVWTVERRQSNAEEIARRAGLLYDKVAGFVDNLSKVGLHLEQAGRAHGEAIAQLSTGRGNLLGQIEKLKDMGAKTRKNIAIEFDTEDEADLETEQPVTPDTQVPEPAFRPGKD